MIGQLLKEKYSIDALEISRLLSGVGGMTWLVRTTDERFVLKGVGVDDIYIKNEPEIAEFLKYNGVSTAEFIKTKDGEYIWEYDGALYHLQRFVDGEVLPFNKAPDWFMRESARTLGKIHAALSKFKPLPVGMGEGFINYMHSGNVRDSYEKTLEQAKLSGDEGIISDVAYRLSQVDKLQSLTFYLSRFTCTNTHGDYKISQIICGDNRINAVIDWTSACVHPICWEIIRSFTCASPHCGTGEIDIKEFIKYVKEYLEYFPLNEYDLKMMPYFYYHQLLACDYYAQYYASNDENREDFLFQARFATGLIRWFENGADELSERLSLLEI